MDPAEYQRLRERIQALDDRTLLDLVAFRVHEYRAEALQIAQEEFRSRGFTDESLATFRTETADSVRHSLGSARSASTRRRMTPQVRPLR